MFVAVFRSLRSQLNPSCTMGRGGIVFLWSLILRIYFSICHSVAQVLFC